MCLASLFRSLFADGGDEALFWRLRGDGGFDERIPELIPREYVFVIVDYDEQFTDRERETLRRWVNINVEVFGQVIFM